MGDLTIPKSDALAAAFADPELVDKVLERIEAEVKSFAPDLSTAKGRAAIKSLAFKVTQSKTAFDAIGKELNAGRRADIALVDSERRKIRERLDALRDYAKAPLDEWQAAEDKILADLEAKMASLDLRVDMFASTDDIRAELDRLDHMVIGGNWGKFESAGRMKRSEGLGQLNGFFTTAQKREDDALELARLRKEAQERAEADAKRRQEHEAGERKEQQAKAKREREEQAAIDRKEAAERATKQAEEKAKAADKRHERELAEAKQREKVAADNERRRIEAEQRKDREAEEKRAANTRRRNKVKADIANSIAKIKKEDIPQALLDGLVAHCAVRF
jgi:hypothetical protein